MEWLKQKSSVMKFLGAIIIFFVVASFIVINLLINIFERKNEAKNPYVRLVEVTEDDTDPSKWGTNWPKEYDQYKKTSIPTKTRFGGHVGEGDLPEQKIERDPWLKRMFLGYAFSIDYRDRRGHAYMLKDQENTKRQTKPQSGSCLHCHASLMPLYRELGNGDVVVGFEKTYKYPYKKLNKMLYEIDHAVPLSCVDCHDPDTMSLRVTRPAFIQGIQRLASSEASVDHLPSINQWRNSSRNRLYDPNIDGTRGEMRSFVCGQCHVEYYCSDKMPLTFPWGNGLKVENLETFWNKTKFENGTTFFDYSHAETGAKILKAQHPEFELWSQGIHAKSGVSCADCHMSYMRDGATKTADHWVRSPLLDINKSCQSCHHFSEKEIKKRVDEIQSSHYELLQRSGIALMDLIDNIQDAKLKGVDADRLKKALEFHRKAQWYLDFIAAENSMGFHAPQESARVLAEAIDYVRQGQNILYNNSKQ